MILIMILKIGDQKMINDLTQKMRNISDGFKMLSKEFETVAYELESELYQLDGRIHILEKHNEKEKTLKNQMIALLQESMSDNTY